MNKKKSKLPELLKNTLVFLVLLAVTLLLLHLPKIYYQRQDEQLLQEVSTLPYSVKTGSEKMTLEQKLTALISDDTLLTTDEKPFYTDDQLDTIRDNLEKQFASLLPAFWSDQLSGLLNPSFLESVGTEFQIIRAQVFQVIDNKTYSFHLNILQYDFFINNYYYNGIIYFDADDYRIFLIELEHMQSEFESELDDSYFYEAFPKEKNEVQLADYYNDLLNTEFQPICEYSSLTLSLYAFSPYDMDETVVSELEDLFSKYQEFTEESIKE